MNSIEDFPGVNPKTFTLNLVMTWIWQSTTLFHSFIICLINLILIVTAVLNIPFPLQAGTPELLLLLKIRLDLLIQVFIT